MEHDSNKNEADRQLLVSAQRRGAMPTLGAFLRLSGPGWLQSALTLGGGSMASSLYLGVLAGFSLLWLQPLAMILGIVMLSTIGYISLSTGQRPFQAINEHVNPVLGWGWALASLAANIVWCLPQFSLANSVLQQNLLPDLLGTDSELGEFPGKVVISVTILVLTVLVTWSYGSGHWGLKLYELMLKLMVVLIVGCFVLVVYLMTRRDMLDWSAIFAGFIPHPGQLNQPAPDLQAQLNLVNPDYQDFWSGEIVRIQRDRIVSAAATAVGINMTFLFPYSLLRKGWTKEFRGLQTFDLCTGMFIPFVLATSCVVITSASQFHAKPIPGLAVVVLDADGQPINEVTQKEKKVYQSMMTKRVKQELGKEVFERLASGAEQFAQLQNNRSLPLYAMSDAEKDEMRQLLGNAAVMERVALLDNPERLLGAMLVDRDANRLAQALAPLTDAQWVGFDEEQEPEANESGLGALVGARWGNILFGIGVLGMTISTITLLMLISGFVICEIFDLPSTGWPFRLACLPAAVGVLGPFVWSKAGFALAIPTSVFGFVLLPVAYLTFALLINQKSLLGSEMPTGGRRVAWNVLMAASAGIATCASLYMVWDKSGRVGMFGIGLFLGLALVVHVYRWTNRSTSTAAR